jgi:breast cancer 2 susceptibility protein
MVSHTLARNSALNLTCAFSPHEIAKIDPQNASFYHFSVGTDMKGPDDAYKRISTEGCSQIGPTWVEQHWSLILLKLASIVRAKPALWETKWTYEEVIRQLKYRCDRINSLHGG